MSRKRVTQIFPWLLPLRRWQRRLFFYAGMRLDRERYTRRQEEEPFPFYPGAGRDSGRSGCGAGGL